MKHILILVVLGFLTSFASAATVELQPGSSITLTCGADGTPPPPPPPEEPPPPAAGCPTPLPHQKITYGWSSAPYQLKMPSGGVAAFLVPPAQAKASIRLTQGQMAISPGNTRTEFSISKCPGVIDTSNLSCYKNSEASNFAISHDIYTRAVYGWDSQAKLGSRGCWAPASEGPWYVNVRWTYPGGCPYASGCGFSMQWFPGSY